MVQFRYTAAAVIVASVVAPVLANTYIGYDNSIDAREYNDLVDYFERDFQVDARDFDEEVFRRDPLFGFIKNWWKNRKAAKAAAAGGEQGVEAREYDEELMSREFDEYFRRELEELMERDPLFGINHIKKWFGKKTQPAPEQQYAERDFEEDIEARDFEEEFEAREFDEELDAREFDEELDARDYELEERDPFLGFNHIKKWISGKKAQPQPAADQFSERDLEELDARDLDELNDLLERDPFLGFNHIKKWFKGKKSGAAQAGAEQYADQQQQARDFEEDMEAREPEYEEVLERYFDDLYERELNEELEVVEREISDELELAERDEAETSIFQREDTDEIFSRGFDLKAWWNNLWHPKKKQDNKKKDAAKPASTSAATPAATSAAAPAAAEASTEAQEAREFEIDELD